jgi:hypothetical protein
MRRVGVPVAMLCVFVLISCIRADAQSDCQTDWQRHMLNEISRLRANLIEYLAEEQQSKLLVLTRELHDIHQDQKRLQDQERQQAQQIVELQQQLASPELEAEARPDIEAVKTHVMGEGAEKLRTEQAALRQREIDVRQRLEHAAQRSRSLQQQARQLQTALSRH